MKFDEQDKDYGCLLIFGAILMAAVIGGVVDVCQRTIKSLVKSEQPVDTTKQAKPKTNFQAEQILWNQKMIRSK